MLLWRLIKQQYDFIIRTAAADELQQLVANDAARVIHIDPPEELDNILV